MTPVRQIYYFRVHGRLPGGTSEGSPYGSGPDGLRLLPGSRERAQTSSSLRPYVRSREEYPGPTPTLRQA